jgi:hypothetical protein
MSDTSDQWGIAPQCRSGNVRNSAAVDSAEVGAELRRYIPQHAGARRALERRASSAYRLADILAWMASSAYQHAEDLADAAAAEGEVIGRLRRDAHHYERDAAVIAQQRRQRRITCKKKPEMLRAA